MHRLLAVAILLCALAGLAQADAAPPGQRSLDYKFTISNLKEYQDYVFLIYPTSNSGFAYVVEPGVGLSNLMMDGGKGEATALYAVPRKDFEASDPNPERYDHGDHGEMVIVTVLPGGALKASSSIAPPERVPDADPLVSLERVVRIVKITDSAFVLEPTDEILGYRDGSTVHRKPGQGTAAIPVTTRKGGCASCGVGGTGAAAPTWPALAALLTAGAALLVLRRRGR